MDYKARYKTAKGGTKEGTMSVERRWGQMHVSLTTKDHMTRRLATFTKSEWFNGPFSRRMLRMVGITSWK